MELILKTEVFERNIDKARALSPVPVSLMFKEFYEYVYEHIGNSTGSKVWAMNIDGSINYSIGKYHVRNGGCVVTTIYDVVKAREHGISDFYVPIDASDGREGLSVYDAYKLLRDIGACNAAKAYGLITCGCMGPARPSSAQLKALCSHFEGVAQGISIGGSFWLGHLDDLPPQISDLRIGEFMLFGTIPFSRKYELFGENGIELRCKVLEVFQQRRELIIDCGYALADMKECKIVNAPIQLTYKGTSSEYSIYSYDDECGRGVKIGDEVTLIPDYFSLVKLRYARRVFR